MAFPDKMKTIVIEFNTLRNNMPDAQINMNWNGTEWSFKVFAEQYRKVLPSADATITFLQGLNADPVAAKAELRGEIIQKLQDRKAAINVKLAELEA